MSSRWLVILLLGSASIYAGQNSEIDPGSISFQLVDVRDYGAIEGHALCAPEGSEGIFRACFEFLTNCSLDAPYVIYYREDLLAVIIYKHLFNPEAPFFRLLLWFSPSYVEQRGLFLRVIDERISKRWSKKGRIRLESINFADRDAIIKSAQRAFKITEKFFPYCNCLNACSGLDVAYFVYYEENLLALVVYKNVFNFDGVPTRSSFWLSKKYKPWQSLFLEAIYNLDFAGWEAEASEPLPDKHYMKLLNGGCGKHKWVKCNTMEGF